MYIEFSIMTEDFNSWEIYDIAQAFIIDKNVTFSTVLTDSTYNYNFQKSFDFSKYTLQITMPISTKKQDFGKIYFQNGNDKPVLLLKTASKISPKPNPFEKMIEWRYFKLIKMIKKRQKNTLNLCDNYIAVMNAIFNLKSL